MAASLFEKMLVTGARSIKNGSVHFVGFHWPMVMARVARRLHAPDAIIVYENGIVEDRLTSIFPTSPCDLVAAEGATTCATSLDALYMWLAAGRVQVTVLEAPIVDRYGNVNTTAVGPYAKPKVRLPGSGGGTELGSLGHGLVLVNASTNRRSYPERVDYITSPGYLDGARERTGLGYSAETGPKQLVNPLGICRFDENGEMVLAALHAGVKPDDAKASFGWAIRSRDIEVLPDPTDDELAIVREELEHARKRLYLLPEG
jgi:glutaconate CoA-transferase, subunit B